MFRAYDSQRERLVAVKLFKLDLPPERVHQLVATFERLIAADLSHPVLASPLATGVAEVSAFLVQDYVAAESLDLAVREYGATPPADALRIAAQLGGALDFGAVADIFHGALHPRDVLLSTDETRLTGLGVARALEQVGVVAPVRRPYTAPERSTGGPWDRRADMFSLAALIHELLWGRRVSGTGKQAAEVLTQLPGGDLEALRVVFTHALAEKPADRFETGLEFAEALKQAFPDVAITGPSPTLNPRAAKRKARAQPEAAVAPAGVIEPLLPLSEPEPPWAPEPVPGPSPAPVVVSAPALEPDLALDARFAASVSVDAPVVPDLRFEPLSPPLTAASFDPRFRAEESQSEFAIRVETPPGIAFSPDESLAAGAPPVAQSVVPAGQELDLRAAPYSVLERTRSAVWPLILALVVGIALGFAAGYGLGPYEQAAAPPGGTEHDGTDGGVAPPGASGVQPPPQPRPLVPQAGERRPDANDEAPAAAPARVAPVAAAPVAAPAARPPVAAGPAAGPPMVATAPTSKPAAPPPVAPPPGRVVVRSVPSGARVVVDGRDRGATPATVTDLAPGAHRVQVTRDGYGPQERRVVITRARPAQSLNVRLTRARAAAPSGATPPAAPASVAGGLTVESLPPGAQVFLDGKPVGVTPLSLASVPAGSYAIHLARDGYRRWSSSVRIVASENSRVTASLEK